MATEVYSLTIEGHVQGQRIESVLHFKGIGMTADETLTSGQNLVNLFDTIFKTNWLQMATLDYYLDRITARRVSSKPSAEAFIEYDVGSQAGLGAASCQSNELRPSGFLVPAMGTKSGGKIFLPPPSSDAIVDNVYDSGYTGAFNTLITNLATSHTSSGITWNLVVWSRKLTSASDVTSWSLSPVIGYQKRSRRYV